MNKDTRIILLLVTLLVGLMLVSCATKEAEVVTLAGTEAGYADGPGTAAKFDGAVGVAVDTAGNVYVADSANHRIRKITSEGTVTTLVGSDQAGHMDGSLAEATFSTPTGIALGPGEVLYVADSIATDPHPLYVSVITPEGRVTTVAGSSQAGYKDGPALEAQFKVPATVAVDQAGNIYVADTANHRIRRVTPEGEVTTLAGLAKTGYAAGYADGPAAEAGFQEPRGMAVDQAGNVYVADGGNHCLRVISPDGQVSTLAGAAKESGYQDGPGAEARFNFPAGLAIDAEGNLYVADTANHRIRRVTPAGVVTTLAGSGQPGNTDGPASQAQFRAPEGVAVDADGNVIVADTGNYRVRKIIQP